MGGKNPQLLSRPACCLLRRFYENGKQVHSIVGADLQGIKERVARATMPIVFRILKSNSLMLGALAVYLTVPWPRILAHV